MESSPIVSAREHAAKAAKASDLKVKTAQHELAASAFAEATKITQNQEAIRTLRLLEEYHHHLAQSIRARQNKPVEHVEEEPRKQAPVQNEVADVVAEIPKSKGSRRTGAQGQMPSRVLSRESSSSIADRLASARGIPANRQSRRGAAALADEKSSPLQKQTSKLEDRSASAATNRLVERINAGPKPLSSRRDSQDTLAEAGAPKTVPQDTEEPFQRFYSTISPLLSKLTAPLAFAGLPLGLEASTANASTAPPSSKNPSTSSTLPSRHLSTPSTNLAASRVSADPDYTPLFSKATLKALRENADNNNHGPNAGAYPFGGAESFYVVPTTGGTKSYANILAHQHHQQTGGSHLPPGLHPTSTSITNDYLDDEFVDASETPQPPSPQHSRQGRGASSSQLPKQKMGTTTTVAPNGQTLEELQLENEMIKKIVNEQSHRIQEFELASQRVMEQNAKLRHGIRESQMLVRPSGGGGGVSTAGGGSMASLPPLFTIKDREGEEDEQNEEGEDEDAGKRNSKGEKGGDIKALKQKIEVLEREMQEKEGLRKDNEKLKVVVGRYRERWEKLKEGARKTRRESGGGGGGGVGVGQEGG